MQLGIAGDASQLITALLAVMPLALRLVGILGIELHTAIDDADDEDGAGLDEEDSAGLEEDEVVTADEEGAGLDEDEVVTIEEDASLEDDEEVP